MGLCGRWLRFDPNVSRYVVDDVGRPTARRRAHGRAMARTAAKKMSVGPAVAKGRAAVNAVTNPSAVPAIPW